MKTLLVFTLLLISNACFSLGHVVSYQEMRENLFGSINHIETCGSWDDLTFGGEFRVLKVFYSGQDMLFVDMVHISENQVSFDIKYGFTFSEINNDHADLILEEVICHADTDNKITLNVKAINPEDKKFEFTLFIDGKNQSYQYKELAQ